jgi:hypothetical protein
MLTATDPRALHAVDESWTRRFIARISSPAICTSRRPAGRDAADGTRRGVRRAARGRAEGGLLHQRVWKTILCSRRPRGRGRPAESDRAGRRIHAQPSPYPIQTSTSSLLLGGSEGRGCKGGLQRLWLGNYSVW